MMYYYHMNLYWVNENCTETFGFFQTPKMRLFLGFLDKVRRCQKKREITIYKIIIGITWKSLDFSAALKI